MAKITRKGGAQNAAAGDSASRYVYPVGVVDLEGSAPAVESGSVERPALSANKDAWREYVQALEGVELIGDETKQDLIDIADDLVS